MKRSVALSFILSIYSLCANLAFGFEWSGNKWPTASTTFNVDIPGADGLWNSTFAEAATEWNATTPFNFSIINSFADPCSDDRRNGAGFRSDACGVAFGSATLAITQTTFTTTTPGQILEADIVFNGNEPWSVFRGPVTSSTNDFRRVAMHELGHAMGFRHEDETPSIMTSFIGNIEVPLQDDINGVNSVYGDGITPPASCDNQTPIDIGSNLTDTLTSGCTIAQLLSIQDNSSVKQFRLTVPIAGRLTIAMRSTEVDSVLWLYDANLSTQLGFDDDSGGGTSGLDSLLSVDLEPGDYIILANAFSAGQNGVFNLTASFASLAAAVLPSSRSVQVGDIATAFATIINLGNITATACGIAPLSSEATNFSYQTTDPAINALTGTANTSVEIAPGELQTYIFSMRPDSALDPTDIRLNFNCNSSLQAPVLTGINTLLLSASTSPVADIIALAATPTADGILRVPNPSRSNAFSVATVNLGAGETIIVSADGGGNPALPVTLSVCQTNPATGDCLAPPQPSVTTAIGAAQTPTFSVFINATDRIALAPVTNRVFVRFQDSSGVSRGATSVAVTTELP